MLGNAKRSEAHCSLPCFLPDYKPSIHTNTYIVCSGHYIFQRKSTILVWYTRSGGTLMKKLAALVAIAITLAVTTFSLTPLGGG